MEKFFLPPHIRTEYDFLRKLKQRTRSEEKRLNAIIEQIKQYAQRVQKKEN